MSPRKPANTPDPSSLTETFGDEDDPTLTERFPEDDDRGLPRIRDSFTDEMADRIASSVDPLTELAAIAAELGQEIEEANVALADGFVVVAKAKLTNRPFTIVDWKFHQSKKFGGYFAAVKFIAHSKVHEQGNGVLGVFTDGGVGIYERLVQYYMKQGRTGYIGCEGLELSEYERYEEDGITPILNPDGTPAIGGTWYVR
jgi:hypothetical protein